MLSEKEIDKVFFFLYRKDVDFLYNYIFREYIFKKTNFFFFLYRKDVDLISYKVLVAIKIYNELILFSLL